MGDSALSDTKKHLRAVQRASLLGLVFFIKREWKPLGEFCRRGAGSPAGVRAHAEHGEGDWVGRGLQTPAGAVLGILLPPAGASLS